MRAYLFLLAVSCAASAQTAHVVEYHATINDVKYLYGPAAPVAHVKPGDIIETNTLDAFGNVLKKPGDTQSMVKGDNPLTGPFYVDGAQPGDTLAVKILDLQVDGNQGVGAFAPGFGALNETNYTPMLHPPLPEKIWFYPIDKATNTATFQALDSKFSVKIPLHPFFGCIGVAPAGGEARSSIVPAEFGGNMDAPEAGVGNTLYLPVNVPGALLYMGDGHAAMGDGEVAGTAIEVALLARVQVSIIKGKKINWPRFENNDSIMTVGAYRPLDDALRIAFTELVDWIHKDYGLSSLDAYELLSKVAKIHLDEMVDPNYVIVASIDKKFLPAKVETADGPEGIHVPENPTEPLLVLASASSDKRESLVERYVTSDASEKIELYTRETKESILLRFRTFDNWTAAAYFDVNHNHKIDSHVDVAYEGIDGDLCAFYLIDENTTTTCASLISSATVEVHNEPGGWVSTTLTIPKIEVSADGISASLVIGAYNAKTSERIQHSFNETINVPFRVR